MASAVQDAHVLLSRAFNSWKKGRRSQGRQNKVARLKVMNVKSWKRPPCSWTCPVDAYVHVWVLAMQAAVMLFIAYSLLLGNRQQTTTQRLSQSHTRQGSIRFAWQAHQVSGRKVGCLAQAKNCQNLFKKALKDTNRNLSSPLTLQGCLAQFTWPACQVPGLEVLRVGWDSRCELNWERGKPRGSQPRQDLLAQLKCG
eukprot:1151159-Pelagomonas_calceolata.AAC.1